MAAADRPAPTPSAPPAQPPNASAHHPALGTRVEVFWPDDDAYYPGRVAGHSEDGSVTVVRYDDGDVERLDLSQEVWRLEGGRNAPAAGKSPVMPFRARAAAAAAADKTDNEPHSVPSSPDHPPPEPQHPDHPMPGRPSRSETSRRPTPRGRRGRRGRKRTSATPPSSQTEKRARSSFSGPAPSRQRLSLKHQPPAHPESAHPRKKIVLAPKPSIQESGNEPPVDPGSGEKSATIKQVPKKETHFDVPLAKLPDASPVKIKPVAKQSKEKKDEIIVRPVPDTSTGQPLPSVPRRPAVENRREDLTEMSPSAGVVIGDTKSAAHSIAVERSDNNDGVDLKRMRMELMLLQEEFVRTKSVLHGVLGSLDSIEERMKALVDSRADMPRNAAPEGNTSEISRRKTSIDDGGPQPRMQQGAFGNDRSGGDQGGPNNCDSIAFWKHTAGPVTAAHLEKEKNRFSEVNGRNVEAKDSSRVEKVNKSVRSENSDKAPMSEKVAKSEKTNRAEKLTMSSRSQLSDGRSISSKRDVISKQGLVMSPQIVDQDIESQREISSKTNSPVKVSSKGKLEELSNKEKIVEHVEMETMHQYADNITETTAAAVGAAAAAGVKKRARLLLGKACLVWFLDLANRRRSPVPQITKNQPRWAVETATACLQSVAKEVGDFSGEREAFDAYNTRIGNGAAELGWFVEPTDENLEKARTSYAPWGPNLKDWEWVGERKALTSVARRVGTAETETQVQPNESALDFALRVVNASICVKRVKMSSPNR